MAIKFDTEVHGLSGIEQEPEVLEYKDLLLCPAAFSATIKGQEVIFTRQEFKILEFLMSNPRRAFSKEAIYNYAWGDIYFGDDRTINVHICRIRKKIKKYTDAEYIETVWGIGFRLAK